jgi:isopropylmalate/homocitrate/citramalate synthase
MRSAVERARDLEMKSVGVNAEDASRTEIDYLIRFALVAKKAGASRFRYCDTLGYENPNRVYKRIKEIVEAVDIPVEMYYHNDLGMTVVNLITGAMTAIESGQDTLIKTTVNGFRERAGNCDLVSTLLALKYGAKWKDLGVLDPRIDLRKAWIVTNFASYAFRVPIPFNQPA